MLITMFFLIKLTAKIASVVLTHVIKNIIIHLTNEAMCRTELMIWRVKVIIWLYKSKLKTIYWVSTISNYNNMAHIFLTLFLATHSHPFLLVNSVFHAAAMWPKSGDQLNQKLTWRAALKRQSHTEGNKYPSLGAYFYYVMNLPGYSTRQKPQLCKFRGLARHC